MRKLLFLLTVISLCISSSWAQPSSAATSQTWMKVTLGSGYAKPVQIHIFADHFRAPWYAHYAVSKDGLEKGLNPQRKEALLSDGESTGWVNISEMIYPDEAKRANGGAHLVIYPAFRYGDNAPRFNATIEFANHAADDAVVKKYSIDYTPSTIHIVMPPNIDSADNSARIQSDKESAMQLGAIADQFKWPQIGKKPQQFPFFVAASIDPQTMGREVVERELKTLSYFGFNGLGNNVYFEKYDYTHKYIGNVGWYKKSSYSAPDLERIAKRADAEYQSQIAAGIKAQDITYAMVMDEPTGEKLEAIVNDAPSIDGFRRWIKSLQLTPQDLLVSSWDDVKIVTAQEKSTFPALYYYSEKYRTIALGNFIALQKQQLHDHWKSTFPVVVNFSDGAVYYANFYGQGVDYFTLLHETDQNAIWSEDWSNGAATYQDASYNVALMQAAARKNGQTLGHYLIAYAGRKGYDIRLKAASEVARGIKMFKSFSYGPVWATHERSPWQKNSAMWADQATAVREIGAVEDMLLPAKAPKAQVALLYSSASDIWNQENLIYGFERMHTWLALTHAQIPVDIIHESEVSKNGLTGYKVCYLADPNITRDAANKLADWVQAGGTLVMTAGAGEKDEYNRPLHTLSSLLPYQRNAAQRLQGFRASGRYLSTLLPKDVVTTVAGDINVMGIKQTFANVPANAIKSTFKDGAAAEVASMAGKGRIICKGYLPATDYMREALIAKGDLIQKAQGIDANNGIPAVDDVEPLKLNEKSYNPWQYPPNVRHSIIAPVQAANITRPLTCSVPLVDAVYLTSNQGIIIPLANYTLQPIAQMTLEIAIDKPVREVRSVYQGNLQFQKVGTNKIRVALPLDCTDYVTVEY